MVHQFRGNGETFNSRPHMEVDGAKGSGAGRAKAFQLTTSHGGRLIPILVRAQNVPFNSRPHMEVDNCAISSSEISRTFQLTTSHGGRHRTDIIFLKRITLSTHDLTWRSTNIGIVFWGGGRLSTHDLTWRSTLIQMQRRPSAGFQLTTSHGGRPDSDSGIDTSTFLSTHDLTWRSTATTRQTRRGSDAFNSRPHMEVDPQRQA